MRSGTRSRPPPAGPGSPGTSGAAPARSTSGHCRRCGTCGGLAGTARRAALLRQSVKLIAAVRRPTAGSRQGWRRLGRPAGRLPSCPLYSGRRAFQVRAARSGAPAIQGARPVHFECLLIQEFAPNTASCVLHGARCQQTAYLWAKLRQIVMKSHYRCTSPPRTVISRGGRAGPNGSQGTQVSNSLRIL